MRVAAAAAIVSMWLTAVAATQAGWRIPQEGRSEKSPLQPTAEVLTTGKALFSRHCVECHGVAGKGDGPKADPDFEPADLSDPARASVNPDGVLFYKILNGRRIPRMPAFKDTLTADEIWMVVEYVKTLRTPPTN